MKEIPQVHMGKTPNMDEILTGMPYPIARIILSFKKRAPKLILET
jgi:hypothetical protein